MRNTLVVVTQEALLQQQQQIIDEVKKIIKESIKNNEPDEVMQTSDVCRLLRKSRQTIENWSKAGLIKKRIIGESVFYLRSDIMKAMRVAHE